MTVLAVCSAKGSPGATTLALALTLVLSERAPTVLVEADPSGGDLAALCGLPANPGLVSLAAAARHGAQVDLVSHTATLPAVGVAVIAPSDPAHAAAAVVGTAARLVELGSAAYEHVVIDCGRVTTDGVTGPVLDRADAVLLVTRPTVAGVEQARVRLPLLPARTTTIVLVDDGPYSAADVESATGVLVTWVLPMDPRGARGLRGDLPVRAARRTSLIREVRSIADIVGSDAACEASRS